MVPAIGLDLIIYIPGAHGEGTSVAPALSQEEQTRIDMAAAEVVETQERMVIEGDPSLQTHAAESSDVLPVSAGKPFQALVDLLMAAARASTDFSATYEPTSMPQESTDMMKSFVHPLRTLFGNLQFMVDANLSEYKQKNAFNRIKNFKAEISDAFGRTDSPESLKEFLEFCCDESKSVQSKGVDISGFDDILNLLSDFQKAWLTAKNEIQPRPPLAQIAATENSIEELKGKLVHHRNEASTDESQSHSLRMEEGALRLEIADQEAQLSKLELAVRTNKEKLALICNNQETVSKRLASHREEIARGEEKLAVLNSEAQVLRSTALEASDIAKREYELAVAAMKLIHDDFVICIEGL